MKNLPYMRWFPADAESDEKYASMTDEELGFYHRCLNKSWINNGIPSDMRALSSLMKVTPKYLNKVWEGVGKCWYQQGDRLFNRRQEEERSHAQSKSDSASAAVRTRYERSNGRSTNVDTNVGTNDLPRALARDSESESDTKTTTTPPPQKRETKSAASAEYPLASSALSSADPTIDGIFSGKIISACVQAYCGVDNARFALTDDLLAQAIGMAAGKFVKGKAPGAGLLLRTVPNVIVNWAKQGIPSTRQDDNPMEVHYDEF